MARNVFNCRNFDWQPRLAAHLKGGGEADLIHFSPGLDGEFCNQMAKQFGVKFLPNPDAMRAQIRKPAA